MFYIIILISVTLLLTYLISIIIEKNRLIEDMRQTIGTHEGVNATLINRLSESGQ